MKLIFDRLKPVKAGRKNVTLENKIEQVVPLKVAEYFLLTSKLSPKLASEFL